MCICTTICAFGQNTIKFFGVPIDDTKEEMISKLESKGFIYSTNANGLIGEFNGEKVLIQFLTVKNKVWQVAVIETTFRDEIQTKLRFNLLFNQFSNNGKYTHIGGEQIGDNVDIFYEMTVRDKQYEVAFSLTDTTINGGVWYTIKRIGNKYAIVIFYENYNNAATGDDL